MKIGADYLGDGKATFTVWAPLLKKVELELFSPQIQVFPMEKDEKGYWKTLVKNLSRGTLYLYKLEGKRSRPDPASSFQPRGVHGPSQVIDHKLFTWEDENWRGIELSEMIIYEIHVGTFTPEGTFEAITPRLDELKALGINVIEIMPIAQFPGERNWGYDGVYPFAVQNSYGGPDAFKNLVNECHKKGIAVALDVVYNHLGPEGNYLWEYGPYFTERYKTLWGQAINFDDAYSNEVRNFFIENGLYWFREYHVDALRIDAIHGVFDLSAKHFLQELVENVEEFSVNDKRKLYLIAESDLNDARVIRSRELGGYGIDAQWCDDFHHCLHTLLTGEKQGYYLDFGRVDHLIKSIREGFVYSGEHSPYRKRKHGNSSKDRPAHQFVVFSQNHDQIGNRMLSERLSNLVSFEALKLAAGVVLLSPYVPLLFMGEEYGEEAPFFYFVSHSDPALIEAVRKGRKEEFLSFNWKGEPPDPQNLQTFLQCKLKWERRTEGTHKVLLNFYQQLIKLRREIPALRHLSKSNLEVSGVEGDKVVSLRRWHKEDHVLCIMNFSEKDRDFNVTPSEAKWTKTLDSSDRKWRGTGPTTPDMIVERHALLLKPFNLVLYEGKLSR